LARNFRRLVAQEKSKYRQRQVIGRARRPAVWSPGEHLVIDWGVLNGLHVFCALLAWSPVRFVSCASVVPVRQPMQDVGEGVTCARREC
jgi:hypothetical protein